MAASDSPQGNFRVVLSAAGYGGTKGNWFAELHLDDAIGTVFTKNPGQDILGSRPGISVRAFEAVADNGNGLYFGLELTGPYEVLKHIGVESARIELANNNGRISSSKYLAVYWGMSKGGIDHWVYPGFLADTTFDETLSSGGISMLEKEPFRSEPQMLIAERVGSQNVHAFGPWHFSPFGIPNEPWVPGRPPAKDLLGSPAPRGAANIAVSAPYWTPSLDRLRYDNTVTVPPVVVTEPPKPGDVSPPIVQPGSVDLSGLYEAIAATGSKVDTLQRSLNSAISAIAAISTNVGSVHGAISEKGDREAEVNSAVGKALYVINENTARQADVLLDAVRRLDESTPSRSQRLLEQCAIAFAAKAIG